MVKKANAFRCWFLRVSSHLKSTALRQLVAMLLLVSLVPSLLIFGSMYLISTDIFQRENQGRTGNVLNDISCSIDDLLSLGDDVVLGLAINSTVNALLEDDDLSVGSMGRTQLRDLIESTLKINRSVLNMIYVETPKNMVYAFTVNDNFALSELRVFGTDYEKNVLEKNGALYWFTDSNRSEPVTQNAGLSRYVRCSAAIYDASGTRCTGIVSLFIKKTALRDCLFNQHASEDQMILILDASNRIVTSNVNIPDALAEEIQTTDFDPAEETVSLDNTLYASSVVINRKTGWQLVSLIPRSSVVMELNVTWKLLIPLMLLPFVCVLMAYLFSAKLVRRLKPMMSTMENIQHGNLSVRVPSLGDSAFDLFGNSLNETLDKYEELLKFASNQEALLTISRLKVLRGQLSPHFLYNILDGVNWMLLENEQYETSHIITDLGYILRYSINESSDTVPLHEEIEVIRRYLSISQKRFESRLNYAIHVAPELEDYKIPRFLLQPIVENAVIHGVEKQATSSMLEVRCYVDEEKTVIDISNDGPSIPDETKEKIKKSFHNQEVGSTHIGLKNVYERIQLYYGAEYGLSMLDMEPRGTVIRLTLPHGEN